MEIDKQVFGLINTNNKSWVDKVTKQVVDAQENSVPEVSNQMSDGESCPENGAAEWQDNGAVEWQEKVLQQQKQIEELQRMMQLVNSHCGLSSDTSDKIKRGGSSLLP